MKKNCIWCSQFILSPRLKSTGHVPVIIKTVSKTFTETLPVNGMALQMTCIASGCVSAERPCARMSACSRTLQVSHERSQEGRAERPGPPSRRERGRARQLGTPSPRRDPASSQPLPPLLSGATAERAAEFGFERDHMGPGPPSAPSSAPLKIHSHDALLPVE